MKLIQKAISCAAILVALQAVIVPGADSQNTSKTSTAQGTFRAGQLIGSDAKDQQGRSVGEVKDFTLNPQTGEMFALIDIGGGHWATVPWQLLKVTTDNKGNASVTVNTTKAVLQSAPSVTKDQWSALQDSAYTHRVYSYFQLRPSGMGATGGQSEQQQGKGQSGQEQAAPSQNQNTNQQSQPKP